MTIARDAFIELYNDIVQFPKLSDIAYHLNITTKSVKDRARKIKRIDENLLVDRSNHNENPQFTTAVLTAPVVISAPKKGVKRFIFTSAQDSSAIHEEFWKNLKAYAEYHDAKIYVAGFTYSKSNNSNAKKKFGNEGRDNEISSTFHPEIKPYLTNDRIEIGDHVVFCGEMNTLPTSVNPLYGFEKYTREKWGIFPHAKVQLQSVATQKYALSKQIMTTGTITLSNYILKKEGIKATFHHIIAAVIVELCEDGSFFCRHLISEKDGTFYDIDRFVENEQVTEGHRVEALNYGDIHIEKLDPVVKKTTFTNKNSLLNHLKPRHQFFHDLIDFSARNHHNVNDPHFIFKTYVNDTASVEEGIQLAGHFLEDTQRDFCKSVVVQSNHDNALTTWLKSRAYDYRSDPVNAIFYLKAQLRFYESLKNGEEPAIFENMMKEYSNIDDVIFVGEDDSYRIAGDIECAIHGHLGANGARGSAASFTKMGPKANIGHSHSPAIHDGIYVAGVSGSLDMGYNRGLSSWAHSHIVTYSNGKRCILTMNAGKWYA